ncbi:hypothetical protein LUZ60_004846 [Juncus effusus]|nr:hypothetical protein LUZ60_004846 [Juncus effusus]
MASYISSFYCPCNWKFEFLTFVLQASKGAVASFYHTLRAELGDEIGITEIIPGLIESEITKGRTFTEEGIMKVDQQLRDAALGPAPVERTEAFARSIVKATCRGARYVLEPPWWWGMYYFRVFIPDISEWLIRFLYATPPGVPATENLAKKLVDLPFVKDVLYPPSLRSPKIKLA